MARSFPARLPEYVRIDPLRSAECRIYDLLGEQLPADFTVFYSRPWLGLTPDGREVDGEADFVVAHAALGFLVIEVKGGAVSFDAVTGEWHSRDRHGFLHRIKNPVEQARGSKHEILRKWKAAVGSGSRFVHAAHGVVLPDSARPRHDLGADMPLRIFAFEDDLSALGTWVRDRFSSDGFDPLGADGLTALERLLARSFELRSPLRGGIAIEDEQILLLTQEQFQILDFLESHRRCAITGGAGTGKTLLAVEKARRLAGSGLRTLLTCYNRPLAQHLKEVCSDVAGLVVLSFHEICSTYAVEAGLHLRAENSVAGRDTHEYFQTVLPAALMEALDRLPERRFDAVVVDEAQDFAADWWIPLELCLSDPKEGTFYVFIDDHQRLYDAARRLTGSVTEAPYRLTRNLRNSRQIFAAARPFYGSAAVRAAGPEGRPVQWHALKTGEELTGSIRDLLGTLITAEHVRAGDIAVLVRDEGAIRGLAPQRRIGRFPVARAEVSTPDAVVLETVRRFKGLERPVVVIVRPGGMLDDPELLYVAMTRARLHLIVAGDARELEAIRAAV